MVHVHVRAVVVSPAWCTAAPCRPSEEAHHRGAAAGQTVLSCGTLTPKPRKGGVVDETAPRVKEPWEATDGAERWLGPGLGSGARVQFCVCLCAA